MSELIELRGGLTIPSEPLVLAWELEARDLTLSVDGEKLRIAGSAGEKPLLSEEDRARIVRWKSHLMALATYRAPERI